MIGRTAVRTGLALASVGLAAACVDDPPMEPRNATDRPATYAAARVPMVRGIDRAFSRIAAEAPGFGGAYYDASGRLNVRVTEEQMAAPGGRERVLEAVGRHIPQGAAAMGNAVFQEAAVSFTRLNSYHQQLIPLLDEPGVVYTDADESTNTIRIGVLAGTSEERIRQIAADFGVPVELVNVEISPAIEPFSGETLRDKVQPVGGGIQLVWEYPGVGFFLCTLGFVVLRDEPGQSQPYFITNSHCTGDRGIVTGTEYYNPAPPPFASDFNLLGFEVLDPPSFQCSATQICRFSDAALVKMYRNNPVRFGSIWRTTEVSEDPFTPGSIEIADDGKKFFSIVDEVPFPLLGEFVDKIGRTSGWTRGEVALTCVNVGVSGSNQVMLCQDLVLGMSAGGDSGSPVFQPHANGRDAALYGILWGGGAGIFAFSALENIRFELGDFTTH